MKTSLLLSSLAMTFTLVACGDAEPVATTYKKNYYSGEQQAQPENKTGTGNGEVKKAPAPTPAPQQPSIPAPNTGGGADAEEEEAPAGGGDAPAGGSAGDATKGAELLANCKACHAPGGPAAGVSLNKAAIGKLDNAIGGGPSAFHKPLKASFEGDNRKNLEAALNKIN